MRASIKEIREALTAACDAKVAEGWKIFPAVTYAPENKVCCPLGALVGDRWVLTATSERFEVPWTGMKDFITGFDGLDYPEGESVEMFNLGVEFRRKYVS